MKISSRINHLGPYIISVQITKIFVVIQKMECEECMESEQVFICQECDEALCEACDALLHKGGNRKSHRRPRVCKSCRTAATKHCTSCDQYLCDSCVAAHKTHSLSPLGAAMKLGVFWDMGTCRPVRSTDIAATVEEITSKLGQPSLLRAYGDPWGCLLYTSPSPRDS